MFDHEGPSVPVGSVASQAAKLLAGEPSLVPTQVLRTSPLTSSWLKVIVPCGDSVHSATPKAL